MTIPRLVVLACSVLALFAGAIWEAIGLLAFVLVLFWAWPEGIGQRPVPFRFWWW